MEKSRRKDIITYKYGHLIIIGGIHRWLTTTQIALVYHIIVNERGGMQQFKAHSGMLGDGRNLTKSTRNELNQDGSHALTTLLTDVCKRLCKQPVWMGQRVIEKLNKSVIITLNRPLNKR